MARNPAAQDRGHQGRRHDPIVKAGETIAAVLSCRLLEVIEVLERRGSGKPGGHTNINVTSVELKSAEVSPMTDHMPKFTLPSSSLRAGLAVVGPKKADGSYATGGAWSTSDETSLPLEAAADTIVLDEVGAVVLDENGNQIPVYNVIANTPGTPADGTTAGGTVTWKAAGMADVDVEVAYGDPALGHAAITAREIPEV